MADQSVVLDQVRRFYEYAGADVDRADELYHDDAVLEFPQSGERFEGQTSFTEWRRRYPAEVRYRVRRITAREDLAVVEVSASYTAVPGSTRCNCWSSATTRWPASGSIVMEGWEAPGWRAPGARPRPQTHRSEARRGPSSAADVAGGGVGG
jgi:hypothetical protein